MAEGQHAEFDFEDHRRQAEAGYQAVRALYQEFAECLRSVLTQTLDQRDVNVASVEARAKEVESFGKKAVERDDVDSTKPKYASPLTEITDMSGVRVITFFPRTVDDVSRAIELEFHVVEKTDKAELLRREERFGYQSVHYLVRLRDNRARLAEYAKYKGLVGEIQLRTVLQHAWAEIEHDIQYKSAETIPAAIRRRFMALAGLLELADREFQAIQDQDEALRLASRKSVEEGRLDEVELTPDSLKAYLDKKMGSDARVADYTYDVVVRQLRALGFRALSEVDACIAGYDDDKVSRVAWGARQGQITRFETLLLAGMGEEYVRRHPWRSFDWFVDGEMGRLGKMRDAGVEIRNYLPPERS